MIDPNALSKPGNVDIEDETHLALLQEWAQVAKSGGSKILMQINHPGKQVVKMLNPEAIAPSVVALGQPHASIFSTHRTFTNTEICNIIERFATTAAVTQKAGFDGVQLHDAHGYLISQLLSPHHNRRSDE